MRLIVMLSVDQSIVDTFFWVDTFLLRWHLQMWMGNTDPDPVDTKVVRDLLRVENHVWMIQLIKFTRMVKPDRTKYACKWKKFVLECNEPELIFDTWTVTGLDHWKCDHALNSFKKGYDMQANVHKWLFQKGWLFEKSQGQSHPWLTCPKSRIEAFFTSYY